MVTAKELEKIISKHLDEFYRRRVEKINDLNLNDVLKRKNPYLFKATGVVEAAEIVKGILSAYVSSSDETIFGDAFFEPLAKEISGGVVSPSEGVDVAIETETTYTAIAVKSGTSVFNSDSKNKQLQNFQQLERRLKKLKKHFDPLIGYAYGKKRQKKNSTANYRELAGQSFWREITDDSEFYLKIIRLMKDKPRLHRKGFDVAFGQAVNRFSKKFIDDFCDAKGAIDWDKLTAFNSGE